jgi:flagellar hook protein FlgE
MSLIGALNSSSLAMMAQSQGMQTVSNNIANVNTTSYKREETLFATLLSGQKANGTDKMFSVKSLDRRSVMAPGLIASTGRSDDLALNGEGFFVVSRTFGSTLDGDVYYTRDGALQQKYVDDGSGTQRSYYTTANGKYLLGWAADEKGEFTTSNSLSGLVPVRAFSLDELSGVATTQALMAANIPANTKTGDTVALQGAVYDSTFSSQTLTYTWTKTGADNWTVDFGVTGGTVSAPAAGATAVSFTGAGKLSTPQDPVQVSVTWADGSTGTIAVDLSEMEQFADATTVYRTWQDGSKTGRLYDESFDSNGVLWGSYTNGRNRALYKIPVAEFVAPNSLEAVSGNLFRPTENAGAASIRDLEKEQQNTTIEVGNLESSNVDLADEFTRMMMVQKAYTMASTNFRTVDEMMETAASMKR